MEEQERVEHIVVPFGEVSSLVAQAGKVYLKDCVCRRREQGCASDVDVCLHFEGAPPEDLEGAEQITAEEAQAVLRSTAEWGAIYQIFYYPGNRRLTEICSCCGCCCSPLRGMKAEGNLGQQRRTGYLAFTDDAVCVGCGECEEACFFEARKVKGDRLHLAQERCFGCGVCVNSCPEQAIKLELTAGRGEPISVWI